MASSNAATSFMYFAFCVIGVAQGFALVQLKADKVSLSSIEVVLDKDGPPHRKEVMDILKNINTSLDWVNEAVSAANSTAFSMVDEFLQALATMQDRCVEMSTAAAVAAQLTGVEDLVAQTTKFVDKANATLSKAQSKVPATLDKVAAKSANIMQQPSALADKVAGKFVDALNTILGDLFNESTAAQSMYDKQAPSHRARRAHQSRRAHQHERQHGHKAEAVALLQDRVFQDRRAVSVSSVESAFWPKKSRSTPCGEAAHDITQANSSLESLSGKVAEINATIASLLAAPLGAALEALDAINATVAPALADIPGSLAQPVSDAFDALLSKREALESEVQSKGSQLAAIIDNAIGALDQVVPLANTLQAAVDEACEKSSNGTDAGTAGSSNTTKAGAGEVNDIAAAKLAEHHGRSRLYLDAILRYPMFSGSVPVPR